MSSLIIWLKFRKCKTNICIKNAREAQVVKEPCFDQSFLEIQNLALAADYLW